MPFRNTCTRASDERVVDMITPRGTLESSGINIFDNAFGNKAADGVEWNDWMRWEVGNTDLDDIPMLDRKYSGSSVSSADDWYSDLDASFEVDHPSQLANAIPSAAAAAASYRGFNTLSAAEERSLQAIAMPPLNSPITISRAPSPPPSPVLAPRKTKKRKAASVDPSSLSQSRKRGHNAIEKRYRTNLNDKISELRAGVPELCRSFSSENDEEHDSDAEADGTGQARYGKAAILTRALEYIKHLEATTQRLGSDVVVLKVRVGAFEKLAMNGSIGLNYPGGSSDGMEVEVKKETLRDIQADFRKIKPEGKSAGSRVARRRQSKQEKGC